MGNFDTSSMEQQLRQLRDDRTGRVAAVRGAGEHVLKISNQHAPEDTGRLKRSGKVVVDESDLSVNVFYDTPYAVDQHEDLSLHHDSGGTAKYLENAFNSERNVVRKIMADHLAFG